jgi:hypothetical protein
LDRLSRNNAINKIIKTTLSTLSDDARESHILNWWGLDESNPEFSSLSEEMQKKLTENEAPPSDTQNKLYNELITIALSSEYKGVQNTYISDALQKMGLGEYDVYGDIELLEKCPCCGFRTLPSKSNYDICGLCHWEDNGVVNPETYSGPNHMTLKEAKERFKQNMLALPLDKWVKGDCQ